MRLFLAAQGLDSLAIGVAGVPWVPAHPPGGPAVTGPANVCTCRRCWPRR